MHDWFAQLACRGKRTRPVPRSLRYENALCFLQLIHEIHLLAVNPHLAIASAWLRALLHALPPTLRAYWLIRYAESNISRRHSADTSSRWLSLPQVLEAGIRHSICTMDVVLCIRHIQQSYYSSAFSSFKYGEMSSHFPSVDLPRWLFSNLCICGETTDVDAADDPPLCLASIPREDARRTAHLRNINAPLHRRRGKMVPVQEALGILDTLCSHSYNPDTPSRRNFVINANSLKGAPLTLACASGATKIVRFLLAHGADPSLNGGVAVRVAIRRRDVALVRMLVERSSHKCSTCSVREDPDLSSVPGQDASLSVLQIAQDGARSRNNKNTRSDPRPSSVKRRRLLDRVEITPDLVSEAIRVDARDVVNYFVMEKGCSPDLRTLGRAFFK